MHLRPYQVEAVKRIGASLRDRGNTCFRLPTGGGKTAIFGFIARRYQEAGKRVVITVPRRLLVEQVIDRLAADWGVDVGVICAGYPQTLSRNIQVASVQSLASRLTRMQAYLAGVSLTIVDEAHHSTSAQNIRVLAATGGKILGVTATPKRLDDKPLNPPFCNLVIGTSEADLIADGYLAGFRLFMPRGMHDPNYGQMRETEITAAERTKAEKDIYRHGDAIKVYRQWLTGKRAIAFCYSVQDSVNVAGNFLRHGIPAEAVHGKMRREDVSAAVARYEAGETLVLTCCDLINEGFDVKETAGVLLMAKTQSLTRNMQNIGRALRPKMDGAKAIIVDMVGNTYTHGLPDDPREWSLYPVARNKREKRARMVRDCPRCFAANSLAARKCRECGYDLTADKVEEKPVTADETADMSEVEIERFKRLRSLPKDARLEHVKKATSREQLEFLRRAWGYKAGWTDHVLKAKGLARQRFTRPLPVGGIQ